MKDKKIDVRDFDDDALEIIYQYAQINFILHNRNIPDWILKCCTEHEERESRNNESRSNKN